MTDYADYIAPRIENISQRELKETLIWVSDDRKTVKPVYPKEFWEGVEKTKHENDKR